jgi:DNA-binding transcriptional LysR family regulator
MDISALLDFNLVARHGGFSPASRASGRPKATLSRKVIELEAQMGVRLFERGAKGLRLTDAGAALHARTAGHFAEIEAAAGAIEREDGSLSGRLRVSAPVLFAHAHLGRIATEFSLAHPAVELFVVADDSIADLVESSSAPTRVPTRAWSADASSGRIGSRSRHRRFLVRAMTSAFAWSIELANRQTRNGACATAQAC